MARIRSIKPEFPQSETIGSLSRDARLLFIQLWTIVDDEGRTRAASRMLASLLYPYDDDAPKLIGKWLDELERAGCIRRYEVEGSAYLDIPNWLKHQKIDRPSKSRFPAFVEPSSNPREDSRALDADLGPRTLEVDLGEDHREPVAVATRPARRRSATSFCEGVGDSVPDEWIELAKERGLSEDRAKAEAERFHNHALQKDRKCVDWLAAWRNWLTSPYQSTAKTQGKPHVAEDRSLVAAARRAAERFSRVDVVGDAPSEPVLRIVSQG